MTSLLRGTSIVSSLTLVSRILGFVREILVARLFGSTAFADAYFVALRIPNLLRSIFAEGALTSAFVPVFSKELHKGKDDAQLALGSITSLLLISTTVMSLLGIWFSPEIVNLFAPGFGTDSERFELCVLLTRIMFPYIAFVSLIAMLNGALNSVRIFGASALAQVVMNIILIVGACIAGWYESRTGAIILAWSVIIGGIAQVIAQIPALRRSGFTLRPSKTLLTPAVRRVLNLMIPAILGAAVYQLAIFLNTQLASVLEPGSVAWLSYADRLTQLPIGVFTIALASVLLPALSQAEAQNDSSAFGATLTNSLRYTSFIMIPIASFLYFFAEPLIQIMFERGQFTPNATHKTAFAVQMYSVGLWGVSCHSMVVRAFNAKHDTRTPTLVGIFSLLSTLFLSLLFMGAPESSHSSVIFDQIASLQRGVMKTFPSLDLGHAGLALASGFSFTISFLLIAGIFEKRIGGVAWNPFVLSTLKSLLSSAGAIYVLSFLEVRSYGATHSLLYGFPLFCIVTLGLGLILRNHELRESLARFEHVLRKK